jgi:hypothetical protein
MEENTVKMNFRSFDFIVLMVLILFPLIEAQGQQNNFDRAYFYKEWIAPDFFFNGDEYLSISENDIRITGGGLGIGGGIGSVVAEILSWVEITNSDTTTKDDYPRGYNVTAVIRSNTYDGDPPPYQSLTIGTTFTWKFFPCKGRPYKLGIFFPNGSAPIPYYDTEGIKPESQIIYIWNFGRGTVNDIIDDVCSKYEIATFDHLNSVNFVSYYFPGDKGQRISVYGDRDGYTGMGYRIIIENTHLYDPIWVVRYDNLYSKLLEEIKKRGL